MDESAESAFLRDNGEVISDEDKAYFQQRAEAEIQLAQAAEHERAVRSHYVMASHYLDLVHNEGVHDVN